MTGTAGIAINAAWQRDRNNVSHRTERVGNVIRGIVADAIQSQLNDPRIAPLTSIVRVEVTPDFALARIHVSVMGKPARQELCVKALRGAAGRLRTLVKRGLTTRQIPQLEFHLDDSIQHGIETVDQLDQLMEEQNQRSTAVAGADDTDTTADPPARAED